MEATHASTTNASARLFRKGEGQSSRRCFICHLLMDNRNALIVDAAQAMLGRRKKARRNTLGADKTYHMGEFVVALREGAVTPHFAIDGHVGKTGNPRKTRVDRRTRTPSRQRRRPE